MREVREIMRALFSSMIKTAAPAWMRRVKELIAVGDHEGAARIAQAAGSLGASPRTVKMLGAGMENVAFLHAGALPRGIESGENPGLFVGKYLKRTKPLDYRRRLFEETEASKAILGDRAADIYGHASEKNPTAARFVEYLPGQASTGHVVDMQKSLLGKTSLSPEHERGIVPIRMNQMTPEIQQEGIHRLEQLGYKVDPSRVYMGDLHQVNIGIDPKGNLKAHDPLLMHGDGRLVAEMEGGDFTMLRDVGSALRDAKGYKPTTTTNMPTNGASMPAQAHDILENTNQAGINEAVSAVKKQIIPSAGALTGFLAGGMAPEAIQGDDWDKKSTNRQLAEFGAGALAGTGAGYGLGSLITPFFLQKGLRR